MVRDYFEQITSTLAALSWIKSVNIIRYDILTIEEDEFLIYRIRLTLYDGGLLEMSERVVFSKKDGTLRTTTYSFHWQNANNELIKRWDNAPHHPEISTYPHHVHVSREDNVMSSFYITGIDVINLINKERTTLWKPTLP